MNERAIICLVAIVLAGASIGRAMDLSATVIEPRMPIFDANNHLIRRFSAKSAIGSLTDSRFEKGRVEFFAPTSAEHSIAILDFDRAHYVKADERIDGDGLITLTTTDSSVRGEGFACTLEAGELTLKSNVTFHSTELNITAERGVIRFDPKAVGTDQTIKEAVLTDRVIFQHPPTVKAPFDRAESTLARYDAAQNKVFLKTPVTLWSHGQKIPMQSGDEFMTVDLGEKKPAPASAK